MATLYTILDNLAAVVVAAVAVYGVSTWRRQRNANLAEDTIRQVYQARDIIRMSRFPYVVMSAWDGERLDDGMDFRAPARQLRKQDEVFSKLAAVKGLFCNLFGEEVGEHFDDIKNQKEAIIVASLLRADAENLNTREQDARPETMKNYEECIGHRRPDTGEDKVMEKVDRAVTSIEAICRQELLPKSRWRACRRWINHRIGWS